jgi:hypothetical protein
METEHIILVLIVVIAAFFLMREDPSPVISQMSSSTFKMSDNQYKYEYQLERNQFSVHGTLINMAEHPKMIMGGTTLGFHYFNNETLALYKRTINPKICNPLFFFSHAKFKQLIPSTAEISIMLNARFAEVKSASYSTPASWRYFSMKGYCVNNSPKLEIDGKITTITRGSMFENCTTMVVTDFKLIDQTVVASY